MTAFNVDTIGKLKSVNFNYFHTPFERLNADKTEADALVNSDAYIVKQAFHEFRYVLNETDNRDEAVKAAAPMLGNDFQIEMFLAVILASELCGQNPLRLDYATELIPDEQDFELTPEEEARYREQARKNLAEHFAKKEMETAVVETGNDSVFDID